MTERLNLENERTRSRSGSYDFDPDQEYQIRLALAIYELTDTTKAQGKRVELLTWVLVAATIALLAFTGVIAWLTWELVTHEVWRGAPAAAAIVTSL